MVTAQAAEIKEGSKTYLRELVSKHPRLAAHSCGMLKCSHGAGRKDLYLFVNDIGNFKNID